MKFIAKSLAVACLLSNINPFKDGASNLVAAD
jgi:hypothetical protein